MLIYSESDQLSSADSIDPIRWHIFHSPSMDCGIF